jgi:hypothetical protein
MRDEAVRLAAAGIFALSAATLARRASVPELGLAASAVRTLERVLQLLNATPTPLRTSLEATLARYREGLR